MAKVKATERCVVCRGKGKYVPVGGGRPVRCYKCKGTGRKPVPRA